MELLVQTALWLYRRILALYPGPFHARFGEEMEDTFGQLLADTAPRGFAALLICCLRESGGLLRGALIEQARARRRLLLAGLPAVPEPLGTQSLGSQLLLLCLVGALLVLLGASSLLGQLIPRAETHLFHSLRIGANDDYASISGQDMRCALSEDAIPYIRCQGILEGERLLVTLRYGNTSRTHLGGCWVDYRGETHRCGPTWLSSMLPAASLDTNLGLSGAALQGLRERYWLVNRYERDWFQLVTLIACGLAALTAVALGSLRVQGGRVLASFGFYRVLIASSSLFVFGAVWLLCVFRLLQLWLID